MLKNALDWLVGSGELYEKPVAVLSGSPRPDGGAYVRRHLEETLRAQGATVLASVTVAVPRADVADPAPNPAIRSQLGELLGTLHRAP